MAQGNLTSFKKTVLEFYAKHGRHHLPWRKTTHPYRILVSEVMLQQTQVDRVIPYYKNFLKKFPTVNALAQAPLGEVLRAWSGLGYNRRAKMLHDAAKEIIVYDNFPREYKELIRLPGVGDYTAKAVRVFAFDEPEVLIETNVRTVFIHHFFPRSRSVSDRTLLPLIEHTVPHSGVAQKAGVGPREWYAAIMDYGTHLKKTHGNAARRSAHYIKQKPLKGSNREVRGALLKALQYAPRTVGELRTLPFEHGRLERQLTALVSEGFVVKSGHRYHLP